MQEGGWLKDNQGGFYQNNDCVHMIFTILYLVLCVLKINDIYFFKIKFTISFWRANYYVSAEHSPTNKQQMVVSSRVVSGKAQDKLEKRTTSGSGASLLAHKRPWARLNRTSTWKNSLEENTWYKNKYETWSKQLNSTVHFPISFLFVLFFVKIGSLCSLGWPRICYVKEDGLILRDLPDSSDRRGGVRHHYILLNIPSRNIKLRSSRNRRYQIEDNSLILQSNWHHHQWPPPPKMRLKLTQPLSCFQMLPTQSQLKTTIQKQTSKGLITWHWMTTAGVPFRQKTRPNRILPYENSEQHQLASHRGQQS